MHRRASGAFTVPYLATHSRHVLNIFSAAVPKRVADAARRIHSQPSCSNPMPGRSPPSGSRGAKRSGRRRPSSATQRRCWPADVCRHPGRRLTLEDETGTANAVVVPRLYERSRVVLNTSPWRDGSSVSTASRTYGRRRSVGSRCRRRCRRGTIIGDAYGRPVRTCTAERPRSRPLAVLIPAVRRY